MSKEAMKLALEALEKLVRFESDSWELGSCRIAGQATRALREALAEQPAQQEPVGYFSVNDYGRWEENENEHGQPFYTSPQPAPVAKPHEQEPVARQYQNRDGVWKDFISEKHYKDTLEDGSWPIRNLYTSPPAQRKPLTDEAIATVYWGATGQSLRPQDNVLAHNFARSIEAAHGIKENT